MCASASRAAPRRRPSSPTTPIATANPKASASAWRVPPLDDQAAHALDQVRDRVQRRDGPEPVDLDQVARHVHRGEEQEDEQHGEEPLHGLARAGAQRGERAQRAEREHDQGRRGAAARPRRARRTRAGRRPPARPRGRRAPAPAPSRRRRRAGRARSAVERIGVSASRFRKPVWMSRARSVPAFIVANSAPWMNGTASANARKESVGKPGSCSAESRPPALTASSISGKRSGATTFAGWRSVRTTERRASWAVCAAAAIATAETGSRLAAPPRCRALERAAGLGEEDVVERRLVER